jgi:hypothetical protein
LTDPTLDHAGRWYHHGFGAISKKTADPALSVAALGHIDLILLSHHQHGDNFDRAGKELAKTAPLILSTQAAAKAVPGTTGLRVWDTYVVENEKLIPPEERYFKEVLSNQLLINKEVDKIEVVKKEFQQQLTHQILSLRFTKIYLNTTPAALKKGKWVKMKALVKYPFPKTINDFLLQSKKDFNNFFK